MIEGQEERHEEEATMKEKGVASAWACAYPRFPWNNNAETVVSIPSNEVEIGTGRGRKKSEAIAPYFFLIIIVIFVRRRKKFYNIVNMRNLRKLGDPFEKDRERKRKEERKRDHLFFYNYDKK